MKEIIQEVDSAILEKELTHDKFLRKTNYGDNELYIVTHHDSPNVMREIGRLRELTFRSAGGGTGKDCDIDAYDTMPNPYKQLLVWDPSVKCILGGYRFFNCAEAELEDDGSYKIATSKLFKFSEKFNEEFMPKIVELGRSFVIPTHQSSKGASRLYTLDNLWDGLGAIWVNNPNSDYFFGKVTMYTSYNKKARNLLLYFLKKYFADKDNLLTAYDPLDLEFDIQELEETFAGSNYDDDYKILSQQVRAIGENIPPLINSYMSLSQTMKVFDTVINRGFGEVEETAIIVALNDMYEAKTERHVKSFNQAEQGYTFK